MNDPTIAPSLSPGGSVPIGRWAGVEQDAALLMRRLGFPDAVVTPSGADGGVAVRASGAVAQVNVGSTATPRSEAEQLYGVARSEGKLGLFFSFVGFTADAIAWAEEVGVALFVLQSAGTASPIGTLATRLVTESHRSSARASSASRPERRLIRTAADAEIVAAEWMRWMGFRDATRTPTGADGGIDVMSTGAVAQVKMHAKPIGRPDMQKLYGAARGRRALFFSLQSYTDEARSWADQVGMALFRFDLQGEPTAVNSAAGTMLAPARSVKGDELMDRVTSVAVRPDETFGALLAKGKLLGSLGSHMLLHLTPGDEGIADGRALAELAAATIDKPLRVITADQLRSVNSEVRLLQRLVPGQVVYLGRVELFPTGPLRNLLAALCDHLVLQPSDGTRLVDLVGQHLLWEKLEIVLEAARRRGQPVDHVLLAGPPGSGKFTLAGIVAREMGASLRVTSGSKLVRTADVAAILTDLQPGDVLFIDEIHRMHPEVEQVLYRAMEDFQLDVVLGSGPTARSIQLDLPKFTLVGATTNPGALSAPLRDRFRLQLTVEPPSPDELTSLVQRIWDRAELAYEDGTARLVAERSIGMPRRARHLAFYLVRARTVRSKLHTPLTADSLSAVLDDYVFDDDGFTGVDWLLQDWGFGGTTPSYGPHGSLPIVLMIASTSIPWASGSDARDGLGPLGKAIPYTLVMPRLRSKNAMMLRWEVRDVPLMR